MQQDRAFGRHPYVLFNLCIPRESACGDFEDSESTLSAEENLAKDNQFSNLVADVQACRNCPRMCDSARVLSFAAGNLNAHVMFVGEAPGRLGADKTEIPFHGDTSGHNFEDLLSFAGIRRDTVYVTNAALCNPRDDRGNNATPSAHELQNCSEFLKRQITIVDPLIVVTLGGAALRATKLLEPHSLELHADVRTANDWFGRTLVPLYHPGQRAMIHRSLANQRSDYQYVAEISRRLGRSSTSAGGATRTDVLAACRYLLQAKGEMSYFQLHKYIYLAEYLHVRTTGQRLTSAFFIRQKDGPYCTDIQLQRLKRSDRSISTINRGDKLFIRLRGSQPDLMPIGVPLDDILTKTLDDVMKRYSYANESDLKKAVYLTAPMRLILRRERGERVNLFNAPIDFMAAGGS
jgi:uracil-DNA glycosylase family 4